MYKLEIKLRIICHSDVSEECEPTWPAREADFYGRLRGLLDRGPLRDALADAGFDVLDSYVSNVIVKAP